MTWKELLDSTATQFEKAGIDSPALTAEYLALSVLGLWNRSELMRFRPERPSEEQLERFGALRDRRLKREPLQYIIGEWEFYGLRIYTTPAALIPRPETELLVSRTAEIAKTMPGSIRIVDIGTGLGAIALALAHHLPNVKVIAVDVSAEALALAKRNSERLALSNLELLQSDVLQDSFLVEIGKVDLLVSNPPYVSLGEWDELEPELLHEPRIALTDESDGLLFYKRLMRIAPTVLKPGGRILIELGHEAAKSISSIAEVSGLQIVEILRDHNGLDRVVVAKIAASETPVS